MPVEVVVTGMVVVITFLNFVTLMEVVIKNSTSCMNASLAAMLPGWPRRTTRVVTHYRTTEQQPKPSAKSSPKIPHLEMG